jgi:hypothetical protein
MAILGPSAIYFKKWISNFLMVAKRPTSPSDDGAAWLAYFSTLRIEVVCSSKTSVNFYQATRRNIPEDNTLRSPRRENLKYHI